MGIETLQFYVGLPRYGEYLDEQWGMFRDDFNSLGPLVRAAFADVNAISGEDDLAGWAVGELDYRNRYRVFYDKGNDRFAIQFNEGTEYTPVWTDFVQIRDSDGRFTVTSTGGLASDSGFYNFDYLTISSHGVANGFSQDMVKEVRANYLDGFYWTNDTDNAPVLNIDGYVKPNYTVAPELNDMLIFDGSDYIEARLDPDDFYTSTGGDGKLIISLRA